MDNLNAFQTLLNQQLERQRQADRSAQEALSLPQQAELISGRQGAVDLFTNPSDSQRMGLVSAGLSLLTSDPTKNLSQRIAQAIGTGFESVSGQVAQQRDAAIAQAQSDQAQAQSELDTLRTRFDFAKAQEANADRDAARAQRFDLSGSTVTLYDQQGAPVIEAQRRGNKLFSTDQNGNVIDITAEVQQKGLTTGRSRSGVRIRPDGTVELGIASNGAAREIPKKDANAIERSQKAADAAIRIEELLTRADEINQVIRTGIGAGAVGVGGKIGALFGSDSAEELAANTEELEAISNELGAESLQLFGGNDTERELLVAISTNPSVEKENLTNERIIKRKLSAIRILRQRPDFEADWIRRNGSLVAPDRQTGNFFRKEWMRFQRQNFIIQDALIDAERELRE